MFTGIVQAVGTVAARERWGDGLRFRVDAPGFAGDLREGESVAVDGVCQTVVRRTGPGEAPPSGTLPSGTPPPGAGSSEGEDAGAGAGFVFEAGAKTLELTTLGDHEPGRRVNLERSLRAGDPLGGHLVQGHVDGVATVREVEPARETVYLRVELPPEVSELAAERGSIAVDGVSLTVHGLEGPVAEFAIIPYTWSHTTLRRLARGDRVNVEADLVARYVRRLLKGR